jgi:outer membrane protein OmpA-like peptidoglycan-associated protein
MADVTQPRHRADEIHIHHRERKRSWWPFALLALFAVSLFALWNYSRRHRVAVERTNLTERIQPALPAPPPPPAPERPVVPVPQAPQAPQLESAQPESTALPPNAGETAQPEAVGPDAAAAPSEPEPGMAAAAGEATCSQTILFAANESALTDKDERELKTFVECVQSKPGKGVILEGRADPRGSAEHNADLAQRRADSVKKALTALGLSDDQLTVSMGGPTCSEATPECWQKNRSVAASVQR